MLIIVIGFILSSVALSWSQDMLNYIGSGGGVVGGPRLIIFIALSQCCHADSVCLNWVGGLGGNAHHCHRFHSLVSVFATLSLAKTK